MKKIGIMTFHRAVNYGAFLQVYALQEFLKSSGYDVKVIDYRDKEIEKPYKLLKISRGSLKFKIKNILLDLRYLYKNSKKNKVFKKNIEDNLILSQTYNTIKNLKEFYPKYDVYITGSDQVWNTNIVGNLSDAYTLNFGDKDIKRISYAASIGLNKIDENFKNDYIDKLNKIDFLSVREENAKNILQNLEINKEIRVVLDPTLLMEKKFWNNHINDYPSENEKYILVYAVTPNKECKKIVNYLSKKTGYKIIHFEKMNLYNNILRNAYSDDPFMFLNLIKNAEFVVANSFHATVFSIIFNKKFYSVPHKGTSTRTTDLLNLLNIKNRIFYDFESFQKCSINEQIDYKEVDKLLAKKRNESIEWLKRAIG